MDGAPPRKGRQSRDQAFDVWLKRGLHQLFDDVVNEPVPEELLKLIEEDRSRQG
ncbi:NepR family anti-sigma factor [Acetobacter okinawensis]|uniref:NepR family anti-sigma factor n=1 Tax=Acetobacter okinawensis TaxID=1076594 RepID=UPI002012469A|nr:NepR family anti-sigma factor [Acetobacter okinawensis]